jgi:hypothetical protein
MPAMNSLRIAEAAHLRVGHGRKGRRRSHRRTADRREAAASRNRRDPQAAAQMADEAVGGTEQIAAHAGIADEGPHQQEHRNDAERIVRHRTHRGLADQFQRRRAADQIAKAGYADETHGHADRHAQQHQHEQRDKTQNGNGIGTHAVLTPWPRSWGRASAQDERSGARCGSRSEAPRRRRQSMRPRRTARSASAYRRS